MTVIHVPIDRIIPNPFQTRRDYDDVPYLADEIFRIGLLQMPRGRIVDNVMHHPLSAESFPSARAGMQKVVQEGRFPAGLLVQLAYGHRRWHAHQYLAKQGNAPFGRMPVDVVELSDAAMLDCLWSENRERADLNPIEQAELLFAKWQQLGTQKAVAEEWGLSRPTVTNKLRLLDLPDDVKTAVRHSRLSERQAMALLPALKDGNGQEFIDAALGVGAAAASSDVLRAARRRTYAPRIASICIENVPMLIHGRATTWPDEDILRRVALGARTACQRCIAAVGPPNDLVCRECPGVTLINSLSRSFASAELQEAPAP